MLNEYLGKVIHTLNQGDAREESYYSALQKLLEEAASNAGLASVTVTVLPKKTEAGNPDFIVWKGQQKIVGYEANWRPHFRSDSWLITSNL